MSTLSCDHSTVLQLSCSPMDFLQPQNPRKRKGLKIMNNTEQGLVLLINKINALQSFLIFKLTLKQIENNVHYH